MYHSISSLSLRVVGGVESLGDGQSNGARCACREAVSNSAQWQFLHGERRAGVIEQEKVCLNFDTLCKMTTQFLPSTHYVQS